MKVATEYGFTDTTVPYASYDYTKITLGKLMDKFSSPISVGPISTAVQRPMENQIATAVAAGFVFSITVADDIVWVFMCQATTNAQTSWRILKYTHTLSTNSLVYDGFITLTGFTSASYNCRGFRVTYDQYTTGTVSASGGVNIAGSGTAWSTSRLSVGSRIGFGSTSPSAIAPSAWYEISAIGSDTTITLTASAASAAAGTPYVIDDMRAVIAFTGITAASMGALCLTKGLRPEIFTGAGTNVALGAATDNVRAWFWLADASTALNTTAGGVCIVPKSSWTNQDAYVIDGTTTLKIYHYNLRAALTLSSGRSTSATGANTTGTQNCIGSSSQVNNGRYGALTHQGGTPSIYFATTTRIYRVPVTSITAGSTTFLSSPTDAMVEVPPGGTNTFAATTAMQSVDISDSIDRLIVLTTGATAFRHYLSRYYTDGTQIDRVWLLDDKQLDQSISSSDTAPHPNTISLVCSVWTESGVAYIQRHGTGTTNSQLYAIPVGADYDFDAPAYNSCITPAISTVGATKFYSVYANAIRFYGSTGLGLPADNFKISARTSGITDNTGSWTPIGDDGDLSSFAGANSIQFKIGFRVVGPFCLASKVLKLTVLYDTGSSLPPELQWRLADSSNTDGTVGFVQTAAFGALNTLTINYYRSDTSALVFTQSSSGSTNGVFEYWSGSSWTTGIGTNTIGLRRRFRPTAGLPTGVDVYAKIQSS